MSWWFDDDRQHAGNRYHAGGGMERSSIIPDGCALSFVAPLFFSFHRETAAARSHAAPRFLRMQNRRACLRCVFVQELRERASTRQTPWHNVADERLGFHNRHVRLAGNREKIISCAAAHQTGRSVMIRYCDLVQCFPIELQWPNTTTHKCARFNSCAQGNNANVIAIIDLQLASELGRNLSEHLRLQFSKMTEKTRHAARRMMFGQSICGQDEWKSGISRRREPIFAVRKPVFRRIGIMRIKYI